MRTHKYKISKNKNKKIIISGVITGLITGLFSTGGGIIAVEAFYHLSEINEKEARAMSIFCMIPMSIVNFIFIRNNSLFNWKLALMTAAGGIIGGIIGSNLLKKINNKYLQIMFIIFIFFSGGYILLK